MPVQEFPGDQSWGYNPAFFFCPEAAYGSAHDLKQLIEQAHQRGMGVFLDMVFAHTAPDSPLAQLYPFDKSPYYSPDGINPWGFPPINHWDDATKRFTRDVTDYWLQEFHIDGVMIMSKASATTTKAVPRFWHGPRAKASPTPT